MCVQFRSGCDRPGLRRTGRTGEGEYGIWKEATTRKHVSEVCPIAIFRSTACRVGKNDAPPALFWGIAQERVDGLRTILLGAPNRVTEMSWRPRTTLPHTHTSNRLRHMFPERAVRRCPSGGPKVTLRRSFGASDKGGQTGRLT